MTVSSPGATNAPLPDRSSTTCLVVGGGPAGMLLALLLARKGIAVELLEEHRNFDRDFRGDTIHPSTLSILAQIGLAEPLLALPHGVISTAGVDTPDGYVTVADFRRLRTPYRFIAMLPQRDFLAFIAAELARYPNATVRMGARVEELVIADGAVRGARYRGVDGGWREVRALVTVGCDGRFSRLRKLGGFEAVTTSPPMDVLWFRVPRHAGESSDALFHIQNGHILIMLNRGAEWQIASVIPKGAYQRLRAAGIEALRALVAEVAPGLRDRVETLADWKQVTLLSVASDRLRRWYRPGLLLIGDAAHTMSPVGGVGITYAIQDAVVAANVLYGPLRRRVVETRHLAEIERRRVLPTRMIQALQAQIQRRAVAPALQTRGVMRVPAWARVILKAPIVRSLPARMMGTGVFPVHLSHELIPIETTPR